MSVLLEAEMTILDVSSMEYITYLRNRALMTHADPVGVADFFDETDFYSVFFINK